MHAFVIRRRSDAKYHAPSMNNAWLWSAKVNRAYYYSRESAIRQCDKFNTNETIDAVVSNRTATEYYVEELN